MWRTSSDVLVRCCVTKVTRRVLWPVVFYDGHYSHSVRVLLTSRSLVRCFTFMSIALFSVIMYLSVHAN